MGEVNVGLSAGAMDRRANGNHEASRRRPPMLIVAAAVASLVIATVIVAGAAVLNYKPVQQHVEIEVTPVAKCDGQPCRQ